MKRLSLFLFLCLAYLQASAQKPYLATAHLTSCLNGNDDELERLNNQTFRSNITSQVYKDGTLYIYAAVKAGCFADEPSYQLKNDTLYLGAIRDDSVPYIIDSTGRISLMKNYDPNQIYCACYYKAYFEFKNIAPDKIPVVYLAIPSPPSYKLVTNDRKKLYKGGIFHHVFLTPLDKGFLENGERVNQYDEQGHRQGKFVIDEGASRSIYYFTDDTPTYMVSYKGVETPVDLKTHYFKEQCGIISRVSEHPNGQRREKSFLLDNGLAWYQLRWDESGKIIYLKDNDKESTQLGD